MTPMITTQSTPFSSPVLLRLCPEQGHRHHPGPETFLIFLFLSLLNNINPLVTYFNSRCCQLLEFVASLLLLLLHIMGEQVEEVEEKKAMVEERDRERGEGNRLSPSPWRCRKHLTSIRAEESL